ncbi:MAG: hypothetical protein L6R41_005085 [Letrouitia leprolyta]|nr:MAG: hypothetical protein L6R41_005085 [Letrouitia leprolyta]
MNPGEGSHLIKPFAVSYKPAVPYTFEIPDEDDMYVEFEHYGATMSANDGYLFMYALILGLYSKSVSLIMSYRLRLQNILNSIIRDRGKAARLSAHQSWEWEHCKLTITMNRPVPIGELLTWIVGLWKFMKRYEYVEADMKFERIWAPITTQGTAKFEIGSVE